MHTNPRPQAKARTSVAASVAILAACAVGALALCGLISTAYDALPSVRARREEAAAVNDARIEADRKRAAAQLRAAQDGEATKQQEKENTFRQLHDAAIARERGEFFALTPKQREALMVERVSFGEIEKATEILEMAQTPAEKARLTAAFAAAEAKRKRAVAVDASKARQEFARQYETRLFANHMNPDGVSATGSTLAVRGWFCSRQFCFNFVNGPVAKDARNVGFKRLACDSASESYSQELLRKTILRRFRRALAVFQQRTVR